MTEAWLLATSETNMGPWLTFWNELVFPFWDRELETAIREGELSQSIASLLVDDVVDAISVPDGPTQLIDFGGGYGLYTIELCRRHSNLGATIFDLQGAVEAISDEISEELADRIRTRAEDYETGEG